LNIDLSQLKFGPDGLIPTIVQDHINGDVLMVAYMNRRALEKTLETGRTHFFSRSRQKMWQKGESSGHVQEVKEIFFDCDADALLVKADQKVAACHTGHRSCFYRTLGEPEEERGKVLFDADSVYHGADAMEILDRLYGVIMERKSNPGENSYTSTLLAGGAETIGKKLAEESLELTLAAKDGDKENAVREAADLIYHTWVMLGHVDVKPDEVLEELNRRFGKSGFQEKAERKNEGR
jgi:phosphoribosyl-ATP pyrophosphohydrolase/phosphoribosyl-AMP cyclohydrolase